MQAGVALNPGTPAEAVENVLDLADMVLVMTVNPGFGGQSFIDMTAKIARIRAMIGERPIHIQVDGGITPQTAPLVARAGADVLVAGSAVFKGGSVSDPQAYGENIAAIRDAAHGRPGMIPTRALFGPGPSNVAAEVLQATAQPCIGHLDPIFGSMMEETKEMLRQVFGTSNAMTFPISAPASLAMEAALVNLLERGDTAIVGVNGVFGTRMADIAARAGAKVVRLDFEWGTPCDAETMAAAIRGTPGAKLVAFVHAETSTGTRTDPAPICAAAREAGMLSVVDTVTGLVGSEVKVDDWGADVVYSGTQKCLSVPPGLAPITFSDRAVKVIRARETPVQSWFCDLNLVLGYWSGQGARSYHHTAPVNAIYGLHAGLRRVLDEGPVAARIRHEEAHARLAAALPDLGLSFLVAPEHRLPQLNVVTLPEGIDEAALRRDLLEREGIEIGAGLGPLAGKVWRIGLMGENARPERVDLLTGALRALLSRQAA